MQGFKGRFVKGSEPESVYWKRRAIVAGAVLVLVLLVVLGLNALGGGEEEPEAQVDAAQNEWVPPSASSTVNRPYIRETPASAEPSESPSPTVPPVEACAPERLMLQVVAAFDEARSGSEVPVSVLVASSADTPCTADLRQVAVELAAGADVVYSTAHCETPQGEEVELADGQGQTVEFTVDGLASEEDCAGARRELPAGDYDMRARLGDAVSVPTKLRLT